MSPLIGDSGGPVSGPGKPRAPGVSSTRGSAPAADRVNIPEGEVFRCG
ncbi:hypothetical protein Ae717Ps2_6652c [Pseudonocardia sp. Ae717_Ps2]|nr:hypothetical protein Ae717Ps2_6652c [Pseudonocardia sp. Ae717_Ps2]